MSSELLIFVDLNGHTVHLPARSLSHWALSPTGSLRLWAVGSGEPIHPACAVTVFGQLEALFPPDPAEAPAPPAPARTRGRVPHEARAD